MKTKTFEPLIEYQERAPESIADIYGFRSDFRTALRPSQTLRCAYIDLESCGPGRLCSSQLEGIAPEDGFTTVLSNSFGLQFVYRGVNTVVQSTSWQLKGKNIDTGNP